LGHLFPREAAVEVLVSLALDVATDPVAEVRCAAMQTVGSLVALLLEGEPTPPPADGPLGGFLRTVCNMASSHSCHRRANCAQICTSLVAALEPRLVASLLLPELVSLASDPVPTVRLGVARLVKQHLLTRPELASQSETVAMTAALRADSDRDVLRAIHDFGYEPPRYTSKSPMRIGGGPALGASSGGASQGAGVGIPAGLLVESMEAIQLDAPPMGAFMPAAEGAGERAAEAGSAAAGEVVVVEEEVSEAAVVGQQCPSPPPGRDGVGGDAEAAGGQGQGPA